MMNPHLPAGTHIPPAAPMHPSRRPSDYHGHYHPAPPPPMQYNPYAYQPHYGPPHPHAPHYPPPQQWHIPYAPQYPPMPPPPRQYHQQSPLVVSSQPHMAHMPPALPRQQSQYMGTPPVQSVQTPPMAVRQPDIVSSQAPSAPPSVTSQPTASPRTPTASVSVPERNPTPAASTPLQPIFGVLPVSPDKTLFQLPWLSVPEEPFPQRATRRRRRVQGEQVAQGSLELPTIRAEAEETEVGEDKSQISTAAAPSDLETPVTSQAPSEAESTQPTTPTSSQPAQATTPRPTPAQTHKRNLTRPVVPIIPVVPLVPSSPTTQRNPVRSASIPSVADKLPAQGTHDSVAGASTVADPATASPAASTVASPPVRAAPKSWADLVRTKGASNAAAAHASLNGVIAGNGADTTRAGSLTGVLQTFSVNNEQRLAFLKPRGLVNTGNMCYMNSILQTLVFCVPFYNFLDQVGKQAAHSFKSDTPLVDAMIMFMREFPIIDSAASAEQLRLRLKDGELEEYGEPFAPEYVYNVIKRLPRFSSMRRGHQQDAEEFLGFLLEGLHDECAAILSKLDNASSPTSVRSPTGGSQVSEDGGWLEVGPKQKSAITRTSGTVMDQSPITKIFGGKLRSELRVPGLKNSVTLEPFQPLQLDIQANNVHNIVDALKGITRTETIHGDFKSPKGQTTAMKQVFIETLPPVLILHLKRFEYNNQGGTQKIWKKIGYPLDLEIPKEVFPPHTRNGFAVKGGLPRYKLTGVVYHHGKNASGGHYTVDVRRQEGREWIRMDDTIIRRVRSEDVAEGGSEEDPKILAAALESHKRDADAGKNIFEAAGFGDQGNADDGKGAWNHINGDGNTTAAKKWSATVKNSGTSTPTTAGKMTPRDRLDVKDNKVAYILFYQKIEP